jgi:hypothetical protein
LDAARVGGTRSTVERWCRHGGAVDVIDLRKLRGDAPADSIRAAGDARARDGRLGSRRGRWTGSNSLVDGQPDRAPAHR